MIKKNGLLELSEVEAIYQKEISIDHIAEVKDAFIFQRLPVLLTKIYII
ncbi:hypothetical protein L0657_22605 [Dyadobacter sp. CY345]|nr:hypothetical protein [Dyadobacter sp. CY345]MCF2446766.1 hypothetical protein [Dyadobacter sp. CY345]